MAENNPRNTENKNTNPVGGAPARDEGANTGARTNENRAAGGERSMETPDRGQEGQSAGRQAGDDETTNNEGARRAENTGGNAGSTGNNSGNRGGSGSGR